MAAGPGAEAHADQSNNALFLQGATQIGGMGGSGGDHNVAGHGPSISPGTALTLTGDFYAGHGGDGYFVGSMVDVSIAIFSPINIAVGAAGGSAEAHQTNNVIFDQGTVQIAGIGGNGGGFNLSSDTIFTGNHAGGGGGDGSSTGSMVDVNFGYFHPINIAVPPLAGRRTPSRSIMFSMTNTRSSWPVSRATAERGTSQTPIRLS